MAKSRKVLYALRMLAEHPDGEGGRQVLMSLTPREEQVIRLRFGIHEEKRCYSAQEISQRFAVTTARIHQILDRAILKLERRGLRLTWKRVPVWVLGRRKKT